MKEHGTEKLKTQVEDLRNALARLKEALDTPNDSHNLVRDGSIQRFEFCAELAWKSMKTFLSFVHKTECNSPPACIRAAFAKDLILDDPFWLTIYDLRNYASHTYKEKLAEEVYAALPEAKKRFDMLLSALDHGLSEIPD